MPALFGIYSKEKTVLKVSLLKKEAKFSESKFWTAISWLSKKDKLAFSTEKVGKKTVKTYSLKDRFIVYLTNRVFHNVKHPVFV